MLFLATDLDLLELTSLSTDKDLIGIALLA